VLHERPIISGALSPSRPTEIKEGMVFSLETCCPAKDGYSAVRIEEEVVVTDRGHRVITQFPAEELSIANRY
jgi:Xaa-Pro aminopeptidase